MPGKNDGVTYIVGGMELVPGLAKAFGKKSFGISLPTYRDFDQGVLVIMRKGGNPIGFAVLKNLIAGKRAEISHIGMLSGFRGNGFGKRLLKRVHVLASELNYSEVRAIPSKASAGERSPAGFFRRHGYAPAGKFQAMQRAIKPKRNGVVRRP